MRTFIAALMLGTMFATPALAVEPKGWFETDVIEGVFYCVTEYAVGVQVSEAGKREAYAGAVDDKYAKFTMKISKTGPSPHKFLCGNVDTVFKAVSCYRKYKAEMSFKDEFSIDEQPAAINDFLSPYGDSFVIMGNRFHFVEKYDYGPVMYEGTCTAF